MNIDALKDNIKIDIKKFTEYYGDNYYVVKVLFIDPSSREVIELKRETINT